MLKFVTIRTSRPEQVVMPEFVRLTRFQACAMLVVAVITLVGCGESDKSPSKKTNASSKETAERIGDTPSSPDAPKSENVGTLAGVIKFSGDPPPAKNLFEKGAEIKDGRVCAANAIPDETLVVDPNSKGIANVFVYLGSAPEGAESVAARDPVIFDQQGCQFVPHALTVQTGQVVKAISSDNLTHNIHTNPFKMGNTAVNDAIGPNDKKGLEIVYHKPEIKPVKVTCDIHPWMVAYHLPLDHSFMAVTDKDGKFKIPNLPAGTHTFKIWHEKPGYLEREYEVAIEKDKTKKITLEYGEDDFAAKEIPGRSRSD